MKLFINTSVVPFNDADQRTICLVGAGMSGGSNGSDRNAGRLCAADGSAAGSCSALWSPEERTPAESAVKGRGPRQAARARARFWSHPLSPRLTYGRGFPLLFWCRGRRGHAKTSRKLEES
jgi:hypothetical protein